jgi:hypothetical protein
MMSAGMAGLKIGRLLFFSFFSGSDITIPPLMIAVSAADGLTGQRAR